MLGQKFGRLSVISNHENIIQGGRTKAAWLCRCDCGKETVVTTEHLRSGHSTSCGCKTIEAVKKRSITHGATIDRKISRLYKIWRGMRCRCITCNSNSLNYKSYKGRGISICSEWRDYSVFKTWALSNGYQENLTIDRIDVNGNYEPSNCRWITLSEQTRNKTNTIYYKEGLPLVTYLESLGKDRTYYVMVFKRLKRGWPMELAINAPWGYHYGNN